MLKRTIRDTYWYYFNQGIVMQLILPFNLHIYQILRFLTSFLKKILHFIFSFYCLVQLPLNIFLTCFYFFSDQFSEI